MRIRPIALLVLVATLSLGASLSAALAQEPAQAPQDETAPAPESTAPSADAPSTPEFGRPFRFERRRWHSQGRAIVSIGRNSVLPKDRSAEAVVSIFGSSTSDGDVSDAVVSVFGDSRATGHVGDSVVAVFGDVYVNGKVGNSVVAVFGDVTLGPEAEVNGEIVTIGGTLTSATGALIHGGVEEIMGGMVSGFRWLRPWVEHCLLYGRPLAFAPGLGWAWGIALGFLALYVLIALSFREGIDRCVATLETHPGRTLLASVLVVLLSPWVMLLLTITVIGLIAIPFVWLALSCACLFGKAVILSWLGRRCLSARENAPPPHPALAVIIGGAIVLLAYIVPVLGAIVFNVLGMLAVGVVVYTLLLQSRQRQAAAAPAGAAHAASQAAPAASHDPTGTASTFDAGPRDAPREPPSPTPAPAPPPAAAPALADLAAPRAGFWLRIGALLLDTILVGAILSFVLPTRRIELLLLASYAAVMWKVRGTTIGGIICNLKIVRVDGRPIDWPTAIVRALGCFLSLAALGLGFLWILFDDERQAWHDKIAGTVVVRVPKGVTLV